MKTPQPNTINQIAQELDCGNDCFYNTKTQEVIGIPIKTYIWDDTDYEEAFSEELKKIEKYKKDFIKFEVLEGFESFTIMEDFVQQLPGNHLKVELENILQKPKPFRNFKYVVENSDDRDSWFSFKMNQLELRVKKILELHN